MCMYSSIIINVHVYEYTYMYVTLRHHGDEDHGRHRVRHEGGHQGSEYEHIQQSQPLTLRGNARQDEQR